MKALGTDVVLIDPQFAPKILAKPDAGKHGERHRGGIHQPAALTCFGASPS